MRRAPIAALVTLAALGSGPALAAAYRFETPLAVQLVELESVSCARPLRPRPADPGPGAEGGRCLAAHLAVDHRRSDGRVQVEGASYLLEQGFTERVALDFGPYAPVVLREIERGVGEEELERRTDLQPLLELTRKQIQRRVHYEVLPHVHLPMHVELAVARLADRFYVRARCPLVITSGPRTPESQALAMYLKLNQGASLRRLYRKTEAADEIRMAYLGGRRARKPHGPIIADMAAVIREQMRRGLYVSPHLKGGAVDIRSRTLRAAAKAALQRTVAGFHGMRLIREEKVPPHFHLELWPSD